MKTSINFILIYILSMLLISTAYVNLHNSYKEQITINEQKLTGVDYLKALYDLSINIAIYNGEYEFSTGNIQLQYEILQNIKEIERIQEKSPRCKNTEFRKRLEKLKGFSLSSQEYYDLLDFIGQENYKIGDVSNLLFERDRKIYFLNSLLTHYMPEYLISNIISHNIIEEVLHTSNISSLEKNMFIEQTKLSYLSAEEIATIINQLKDYEDTQILIEHMNDISTLFSRLSKEVNNQLLFEKNSDEIRKYIKITHKILKKSYKLNKLNIEIIRSSLLEKGELLRDKFFFTNLITMIIISLISILIYYSFRLYQAKEEKNVALEIEKDKTQKALKFKSQFLSNMSHEIRTPLNTIVGLTNVMLKNELNEKQTDMLNKINFSSELLLGVINDILDISKIESGKMSIDKHDFNLKELVSHIESMFSFPAKEKGLSLHVEYQNIQNFELIGDSLRVSQILTNLVSNAIKFTSSGKVNIYIKGLNDNQIRFEVEDSGIGLTTEQIGRLFKEFVQADMDTTRKYGGTGLGLAISNNLIKMMDGHIYVESVYGKGSSFIFVLEFQPSTTKQTEETQERDLEDLEAQINTIHSINILVAEDNKMNQVLLSMLLEESHLHLDFALDGEIAVDMFKKKDYDIVLMDIQMPNMNGYEATQKIREIDSIIPIIALSANVMQEDIQHSLDVGMNAHIAKPIDLQTLYIELLKHIG